MYDLFVKSAVVLISIVFFAAFVLSVVRIFKEGVRMEGGVDAVVFILMFLICIIFLGKFFWGF